MKFTNLSELYEYFDQLAMNDADADVLFASSYIRGFISLAAANFGDDSQTLSDELAGQISSQIAEAKSELSPQDQAIVNNYWQQLIPFFK